MGERVNWGFAESAGKPIINLYSHWDGHERRELLANALDYARPRWSDAEYSTRIVISQIIGHNWANETGFGLAVDKLGDNNYPYLLVYWAEQRVIEVPLASYGDTGEAALKKVKTKLRDINTCTVRTFDDFIQTYATQRMPV